MEPKATVRQKQFLRQLGHKDVEALSKNAASSLIDKLLIEERASGKKFPCPYCKKRFGPRPKRSLKCPSCGRTIIHLSGRFFTEEKVEELNQKDWQQECNHDNRANVKDDWREERQYRREFGETLTVGYLIQVGQHCTHARHLNGLLVLIEHANDAPDLLPPFGQCRYDTCECESMAVSKEEVPRGTRIAEFSDPQKHARLKTPVVAPGSLRKRQKAKGCVAGIAIAVGIAMSGYVAVLAALQVWT